jgi:hypothetical protein
MARPLPFFPVSWKEDLMPTKLKTVMPAVALALGLASCGGDSPTTPTPPPADVAGNYWATWTLQVLRQSDGFQTQFYCSGRVTFVQGPATGSTAPLTGFVVVDQPCAPESYDLLGTVGVNGAIEFTTEGPAPTEGPCPGGQDVRFSGQVTDQGGYHALSARGVTTVTCPEFGDHDFTYLLTGGF